MNSFGNIFEFIARKNPEAIPVICDNVRKVAADLRLPPDDDRSAEAKASFLKKLFEIPGAETPIKIPINILAPKDGKLDKNTWNELKQDPEGLLARTEEVLNFEKCYKDPHDKMHTVFEYEDERGTGHSLRTLEYPVIGKVSISVNDGGVRLINIQEPSPNERVAAENLRTLLWMKTLVA